MRGAGEHEVAVYEASSSEAWPRMQWHGVVASAGRQRNAPQAQEPLPGQADDAQQAPETPAAEHAVTSDGTVPVTPVAQVHSPEVSDEQRTTGPCPPPPVIA